MRLNSYLIERRPNFEKEVNNFYCIKTFLFKGVFKKKELKRILS